MSVLDAVQSLLKSVLERGNEGPARKPPDNLVQARKTRNLALNNSTVPLSEASHNNFSQFPNDLVVFILSMLDTKGLHEARAVCRKWERLALTVRIAQYSLPNECTDEQLMLIMELFPLIQSLRILRPVRLSMTCWAHINTKNIPCHFLMDKSTASPETVTWLFILRSQLHINHLFETELYMLNSMIALEDESRQSSLLSSRAWLYSYLNRVPDGLRDIESLKRIRSPLNLIDLKIYATLLSKAGRYEEAISVFEPVLAAGDHTDTVKANLLTSRAAIHSRALQHQASLRDLEQAVQLDPNYSTALQEYGNELDYVGRHAEALVAIDKAISIDPGVAVRHHFRAWTLTALERYEEALEECNKSLKLAPKNDTFLYCRGFVHQMLGQFEEALVDFQASLLSCINPAAYYRCGLCLVELGRKDEAEKHFHLVTQSDATYGGDYYAKGMVLQRMNRHLEALEQFNIAAQRQPGNWRYLLGRADSLFTQGLYEEALNDWQKACAINSKLTERLSEKMEVARGYVSRLAASW